MKKKLNKGKAKHKSKENDQFDYEPLKSMHGCQVYGQSDNYINMGGKRVSAVPDQIVNDLVGINVPNFLPLTDTLSRHMPSLNAYDLRPLATPEELEALNIVYENEQKLLDNRGDDWIQTYTGKKFYPLNPREEDICIEDAAHALSMQCRFTGHCKFFYPISQHCVLVSYLCDEADRKHALLHDKSEAYICDLASPLKRSGRFDEYKKIEKVLQNTIYRKFGLSEIEPASVKRADLMALAIEAKTLMAPLHPEWKLPCNPPPVAIMQMTPEEAKKLFLDRFYELFGANYGR